MEEMVVIAEGIGADSEALVNADSQLKEGSRAELRFFIENAPSPEDQAALEMNLISQGMLLWDNITYDSGVLVIRYIKKTESAVEGVGLVWFIPVIIAAVLAITGGIFGWQLASQIGKILTNPVVIGGAVLLLLFFLMRPKKETQPQGEAI